MCGVLADSRKLTQDGLWHLRNLNKTRRLFLKGLPDVALTDALLESLHDLPQMEMLRLEGYKGQIRGNITAAAVTRSVRQHTHTAIFLHPEIGILTPSRLAHHCKKV